MMTAVLQPRYAAKVHEHAPAPRRRYFDREAETMPREELERLQLKRLRSSLKDTYDKVPLHRERMKALKVRPQDIRTLEDVRELPFTVKSDLREHYPFGMFARPRAELARLEAPGGE